MVRAVVNTITARNAVFKSLEDDIKAKQQELEKFAHMATVEGVYQETAPPTSTSNNQKRSNDSPS